MREPSTPCEFGNAQNLKLRRKPCTVNVGRKPTSGMSLGPVSETLPTFPKRHRQAATFPPRPPMRAGEGPGVRVGDQHALAFGDIAVAFIRRVFPEKHSACSTPTLTPGPSPALMGGRGVSRSNFISLWPVKTHIEAQ